MKSSKTSSTMNSKLKMHGWVPQTVTMKKKKEKRWRKIKKCPSRKSKKNDSTKKWKSKPSNPSTTSKNNSQENSKSSWAATSNSSKAKCSNLITAHTTCSTGLTSNGLLCPSISCTSPHRLSHFPASRPWLSTRMKFILCRAVVTIPKITLFILTSGPNCTGPGLMTILMPKRKNMLMRSLSFSFNRPSPITISTESGHWMVRLLSHSGTMPVPKAVKFTSWTWQPIMKNSKTTSPQKNLNKSKKSSFPLNTQDSPSTGTPTKSVNLQSVMKRVKLQSLPTTKITPHGAP